MVYNLVITERAEELLDNIVNYLVHRLKSMQAAEHLLSLVDYITPHRGDKKLFWDESNWQPLCKPCHDKKTWNEDNNPTYRF